MFKSDEISEKLSAILDALNLLREDVQRAGVMSGLLSRPGGQSFADIKAIAEKFAQDEK